MVNGYLVAKQGDLVEATYDTQTNETHRVFSTNVSQEVELDVDDVVNFCGDTIHLGFGRTFVGGGRAGAFSFGPHAHDAVFSKGLLLKASTDRIEKSVCAEKTSEAPPAPPAGMLDPTMKCRRRRREGAERTTDRSGRSSNSSRTSHGWISMRLRRSPELQ